MIRKLLLLLALTLSISLGSCAPVYAQDANRTDYETVAASQSDQALGPVGAASDVLARLIIVPATTSPGAVSVKDGGGSAITVFTGGATSVADLRPIVVEFGARSSSGAWKVTTGTNVSVIAVGRFR
jgi:hypothetical protein